MCQSLLVSRFRPLDGVTPQGMTIAAAQTSGHSTAVSGATLTNTELVDRLRTDPQSAVPVLYQRYESRIRWIVRRMMGTDPDQPDVIQQVFYDLIRSGFNIREPEKLPGWIQSFTVCAVYKELRRRRSRRNLEETFATLGVKDFVRDVEARDLLTQTLTMMQQLPHNERAAFTMRVIEGRTCDEIAGLIGCSTPTIKRRLTRANRRMAAMVARSPELMALARSRVPDQPGALFSKRVARRFATERRSN
jgi:RNA polymerase sigma-70 factor (ECF subfamily)